jgi:hypothetical protein
MKTTFQNFVLIFVILFAASTVVSCKKDEAKIPEILNFELGHDNSKTVRAGSDLHVEAEVIAQNRIDVIEIDIHYEGVHTKSVRIAHIEDDHEWDLSIIYGKFRNLKNTTFHEDIEVPFNTKPGEYHFTFTVIDLEGFSTSYEDYLIVLEPEI